MKIEFSNGDIVDRYTIVSIKKEKIQDGEKRKNVHCEHEILEQALVELSILQDHPLCTRLKEVNERLWEIEDQIRVKEQKKEFDNEFIQLARSVYITNDKRASLKREINVLTESFLVEEKHYQDYK